MKLARRFALLAAVPLVVSGCERSSLPSAVPHSPLLSVGPTTRVTVQCPSQMEEGTSAQCSAYGYDANGNFTSQAASAWSSSNSAVAGVSSTGVVTAQSPGSATVSATIAGITGSTPVRIVGPLTVTISGPAQIPNKVTCRWSAYPSGGTSPYTYTWNRSRYAFANYNDWSGAALATYTMTVQVTDAAGRTASASMNVTATFSVSSCLSELE